jgi:hypothetical protein
MAHNRPDNCLVLRDGTSYLLLGYQANSALILRDVQGVGGGGISGGTFSRGRWRKLKDEEERQREAARAEKEREEKRKAKAEAKAEREGKEAREAKRLKRDVDAAIEAGDTVAVNAQAAAAGVENIAQAELHARLMQEAAQAAALAEQERLARQQDENDIADIIELERQELLRHLHAAGLTMLLRGMK